MLLTIFTPTFNRAVKLQKLYNSLKSQATEEFEWLIIDDGSTDETESVVGGFIQDKSVAIRYFRQENGGKHRAYNKALELSRGKYFFCVDSDDWLADGAVRDLVDACKESGKEYFIVAYKEDEQGNLLSSRFPNVSDCTLRELSDKYRCGGEYSLIFPIESARRFPFPTFDGEGFITESVVYDRIGAVVRAKLLPKVVTVCEYQENGLTNNLNRIMKENPAGYCLYFMQRIDVAPSFKERVATAGKYNCFCGFAGEKKSAYTGRHKLLVLLTRPLGRIFRRYYIKKRGF